MNTYKALVIEEVTKQFKNHETLTPRSPSLSDLSENSPSFSGSFQCGNSWFFLTSMYKDWPVMFELDMENKEWKSSKLLDEEESNSCAIGAYSIVSDGAGQVYWYGGADVYFYSPKNDLKVFNPSLKEWTRITPKLQIDSPGGEFPFLEYCDTMEPLDTDIEYCGGPCLFAFGAYSHHALKCDDNLYRYDILSSTWSTMSSQIKPSERSGGTMVHLRNQQKLLLYGGSDVEHTQEYDDLWTFDLSKRRQGWQQVTATGESPLDSSKYFTLVVVIRGRDPKIMVLQESEATKEILFYLLDCSTLHWTILNSHIRIQPRFVSIFQPKYEDFGTHFYMYLAPQSQREHVYSVSIKDNRMGFNLHQASLRRHLSDVIIDCETT